MKNNDILLSELVDGELTASELTQLMEIMDSEPLMRDKLIQHQNTRNRIQGLAAVDDGALSQLWREIESGELVQAKTVVEDEKARRPEQVATALPDFSWWLKQVVGFSIAASIGAVAVLSLAPQPATTPNPIVQQDIIESNETHRWTVAEKEIEERLNAYLLDHNEYAGASNVFANARVIAYDSGQ